LAEPVPIFIPLQSVLIVQLLIRTFLQGNYHQASPFRRTGVNGTLNGYCIEDLSIPDRPKTGDQVRSAVGLLRPHPYGQIGKKGDEENLKERNYVFHAVKKRE
jgi:hypothetical protein